MNGTSAKSGLEKKTWIAGVFGISPFPVIGEIGMTKFIYDILEASPFRGFSRLGISACSAALSRLGGIYPMYNALFPELYKNLEGFLR